VYLDLVITMNVIINFLLLKLAGQVARQKTTLLRLLAGSALGGMLLILLIIPACAQFLMSWPGKLLLPVAMITLSYRPRRLKDAFVLILLFYFCSFILAGLVISFLLWNNYSVELSQRIFIIHSPSFAHLFWAGIIFLVFVQAVSPLLREKALFNSLADEFQVEVDLFAKKKKFSAYLDTGNMLREPFSGLPVAIVSYRAIAELLPPDVREVLSGGAQIKWDELEKALLSSGTALKFRLIPYRSLDKDDYLVAFRPDKITIWQKGREAVPEKGLMVAITQQQLGCGEEFEMLLPLDVSRSMGKEVG
jgi:stage II sporulation protein GA (sporulation sigma-E factor processing peptidase)